MLCPIIGFAASNSSFAQNDQEQSKAQRGLYLSALYSDIRNPHFNPIKTIEVGIKQSISAPGFLFGYQFNYKSVGFGARVIYWPKKSFNSFHFEETSGSSIILDCTDPTLTQFAFDLTLEWIIIKRFYVGIYGLAGYDTDIESYNISGSSFHDWNGQKSVPQGDESWGLGIKISPLKWVTANAEIRWIPGQVTRKLSGYLYSQGGYSYYKHADYDIKYRMIILSGGLSFNIGTFRSKNK